MGEKSYVTLKNSMKTYSGLYIYPLEGSETAIINMYLN